MHVCVSTRHSVCVCVLYVRVCVLYVRVHVLVCVHVCMHKPLKLMLRI